MPKEKIAEALNYVRNHRAALSQYLSDGRLPIDNNDVEQLMKQVAIGRKNWLFIGSVLAGERAANFLTLVSSALRNDLDVYADLKPSWMRCCQAAPTMPRSAPTPGPPRTPKPSEPTVKPNAATATLANPPAEPITEPVPKLTTRRSCFKTW